MSQQPKISIGMPIYNGEEFIRESIDSILAQTFTDFELIITDNTSTDKTQEICEEYAAKDQRIHYHRNEQNFGAAANFNYAFKLAKGDYFKWAAHDDICAPTFLSDCIEVLEQDQSVVLCYPRTKLINAKGNWVGVSYRSLQGVNSSQGSDRFRDILVNSVWCFEVFGLMRSDILAKTSLIGSYYGSDKALLAELSLLGRFCEVDKELFFRRCLPKQSTNLTVKEKTTWIDTKKSFRLVPFQVRALLGYVSAVGGSPLNVYDKASCYLAIMQLFLKADKWKKLLLPGPSNYFGINFKKQ